MSSQAVIVTTAQAKSGISQDLRNNIYSALLSGDGIRNIESTLDELLRSSGFKDSLRDYITDLFRSGQASTCEEARNIAMERIREQTRGVQTNGTNGTNGTANGNGNGEAADEIHLKVPKEVIDKGVKTVMKELERVCEISYEDK